MATKTTNLGRVGFVLKGEFSSTATYKKLDVVTSNGNTYAALADVAAGSDLTDTTKWQKMIANTTVAIFG